MSMKCRFTSPVSMMALLAGVIIAAGAQPANAAHRSAAAAPAATAAANTPQAPLEELYKALAASEHASGGSAKRSTLIAPAVERAFDMDTILKRSIGLHYDQLSADERANLIHAFKRVSIARYASTFKPGTDAVFMVGQGTSQPDGKIRVHTTIGNKADPASAATSIDYIMAQAADGWRITDILLNGSISQVAAQRSDYKAIFSRSGANGLTKKLLEQADDLLRE